MVDISYVTSCFNSEIFLDGLIANTLLQSHEDFEHIIVDSKSTDGSVDIIKGWQEKDDRIKLIEQPERTPYGMSWLIGWQQAQGKVVTNSNTDDKSYPWRGTQVLEYREQALAQDGMLRWEKKHFYYGGYETRVDGIAIAKGTPPPVDLLSTMMCSKSSWLCKEYSQSNHRESFYCCLARMDKWLKTNG